MWHIIVGFERWRAPQVVSNVFVPFLAGETFFGKDAVAVPNPSGGICTRHYICKVK